MLLLFIRQQNRSITLCFTIVWNLLYASGILDGDFVEAMSCSIHVSTTILIEIVKEEKNTVLEAIKYMETINDAVKTSDNLIGLIIKLWKQE